MTYSSCQWPVLHLPCLTLFHLHAPLPIITYASTVNLDYRT